jgi:hypothetical protein
MGDRHGRHGVTQEPVDNAEAAEPEPATPAERLQAARNKLLGAMRLLDELKVAARAGGPPEGAKRPAVPASWFVGPEIETDIERIADELETKVEELANLLR